MRVGGVLEFAAEAREIVRIKRPQNSLLDSDDKPIAESVIRSELGGIDRESYRTMFSLDDETLEKGARVFSPARVIWESCWFRPALAFPISAASCSPML